MTGQVSILNESGGPAVSASGSPAAPRSTSATTRPGSTIAVSVATAPPIELPTSTARGICSASR